MAFLRKLFGRRNEPVRPVLVRVRGANGELPEQVEFDVVWASGRRERQRVVAAQGLCILPWRGSEERVALVLHAAGRTAELSVSAVQSARGAVIEVQLPD